MIFALLALITGSAFAIRMSPASFTAQNVPIGREFDLSIPLVIYLGNDSSDTAYFSAVPLFPSEVRETWLDGYEEIPDPNYLLVAGEQPIAVLPESATVRSLLVYFPMDSSLLNRRFLVMLRVMPVNSRSMFQAVLVGSYMIETSPTKDRFTRTGGKPFAISPSIVYLDSMGKGIARIYNNDTIPHNYRTRFSVPPLDDRRLNVILSPGYTRGDSTKYSLDKSSGKIPAGGFVDLDIRIKDTEYLKSLRKDTEAILWIENPSSKCCKRFFRIHYKPK